MKTAWFHSRLCALSLFTGGGTDYIALHCEGFEILKKAHSLYKKCCFVCFAKIDKKCVNGVIKYEKILSLHVFLPVTPVRAGRVDYN